MRLWLSNSFANDWSQLILTENHMDTYILNAGIRTTILTAATRQFS